MKGTLTLKNPILINNETISEMTYDSNEITGALFSEAEAMRKRAAGMRNVSINPAIEFDFGLHLYLGYAAIIAVNPGYDFNDLERIHGGDLMTIMTSGEILFCSRRTAHRQAAPTSHPGLLQSLLHLRPGTRMPASYRFPDRIRRSGGGRTGTEKKSEGKGTEDSAQEGVSEWQKGKEMQTIVTSAVK